MTDEKVGEKEEEKDERDRGRDIMTLKATATLKRKQGVRTMRRKGKGERRKVIRLMSKDRGRA